MQLFYINAVILTWVVVVFILLLLLCSVLLCVGTLQWAQCIINWVFTQWGTCVTGGRCHQTIHIRLPLRTWSDGQESEHNRRQGKWMWDVYQLHCHDVWWMCFVCHLEWGFDWHWVNNMKMRHQCELVPFSPWEPFSSDRGVVPLAAGGGWRSIVGDLSIGIAMQTQTNEHTSGCAYEYKLCLFYCYHTYPGRPGRPVQRSRWVPWDCWQELHSGGQMSMSGQTVIQVRQYKKAAAANRDIMQYNMCA